MSDTISRQEAIDAFDKQFWSLLNIPICKEIRKAAKDTIKALPSAQPKKGKWILIRPDEDKAGNGLYECSECGKGDIHAPEVEVPFCWHCGAHMIGSGSVRKEVVGIV